MDLFSYLPDSTMGWVNVVGIAVACSSGVAAAIAKLTKNKTDDKVAGYLKKAHDLLGTVGLHGHTLDQKRAGLNAAPAPRPTTTVRDHRTPK